MSEKTLTQGIRETLAQEMRKDDKVFLIGEDVRFGAFGVTAGLVQEFGEKRIIDTPISEKAILGGAIGGATVGLIPVAEIMFADFMTCCFDEIMNQMAKIRYMFGGQCSLPITVRMPNGIAAQAAAQHSQSVEAFLTHIPGVKVVYSGSPEDTPGLLVSAIHDPDPVMFLEHKRLYRSKRDYADTYEPIPLGVASVKRPGKDITVVATGFYVQMCLMMADEMAKQGADMEIIDPRTLFPLDTETIFESVEKTGKLMVLTEENKRGGWGGELVSTVVESKMSALKKPPVRVGALDSPIGFSAVYENYIVPRSEDIIHAVKTLMA